MSNIIIKYIKEYLKEATIPFSGSEISAQLQHDVSPSIRKDMSNLSDKETLKYLMQNIDERTCISFVNKYDSEVPSFSVNPNAVYKTPHGNYAYPLTLPNMKDLISRKAIKGTQFALQRPYFLLFKVNSPNAIIISKDGTTNYKEFKADKKAMSAGKSISFEQDINSILRAFTYLTMSAFDTDPSKTWSDNNSDSVEIFDRKLVYLTSQLYSNFESLNDNDITVDSFINGIASAFRGGVPEMVANYKKANDVDTIKKEYFEVVFEELKEIFFYGELTKSRANKFIKAGDENIDEFHEIYFICWVLSRIAHFMNPTKITSSGPVLTALLKETGIEAIIDQNSSTLHHAEPEQSVFLNFGNFSKKDVEFIGTFRNIFNKQGLDIDELAAEIYKEEGFKYDVDFFGKLSDEDQGILNQQSKEYLEISKILFLAEKENILFSNIHTLTDTTAIFSFNIYLDNNDLTKVEKVFEKLYSVIEDFYESGKKGDIFLNFNFCENSSGSYLNINEKIEKIYSGTYFKLNMNLLESNYYTGLSHLLDMKINYMSSGYIFINQKFLNLLDSYKGNLVISNCSPEFYIIVEELKLMKWVLQSNKLTIGENNNITFVLPKTMSDSKKQSATRRLKQKFGEVKVKV